MLLDVRRRPAGARAEIDDFPSIAAFDGGEDLVDHVRRQLSGRSGLQERDALRPVLFESVLRTLFDEERHASGKLGGEIFNLCGNHYRAGIFTLEDRRIRRVASALGLRS